MNETDPPCTDCGGTGITYQTERLCACQPDTEKLRLQLVAGALRNALTESVAWIDRLCLSEDVDPQHIRAGIGIEGDTLASSLAAFRKVLALAETPSPEPAKDVENAL